MTIQQFIKEKGWYTECGTKYCRAMNVDVSFLDKMGDMQETQFSIAAYKIEELNELFIGFCRENGFPKNHVCGITIVEMAESFDQLK